MCEVLFLGFAEVIDVIARSWWVYKKDLESKTGKELVIAEKQEPGEHYNHWTVNPFSPTQFTELFASISFCETGGMKNLIENMVLIQGKVQFCIVNFH
jgi:hypothetical protein